MAIPETVRPIHLAGYMVGRPAAESVVQFCAEQNRIIEWWSTVIEYLPEALGIQLDPMEANLERRKTYVSEMLSRSDKLGQDLL